MPILVTGATGYIGSRLVKKLLECGHSVRALVLPDDPFVERIAGAGCEIVFGDITRRETLFDVFTGVDTVFHLAAILISSQPELFYKINYEGTKNVIDVSVEKGVNHFIGLSAAAATYRIPTLYGKLKKDTEQLMKEQEQTKFTVVRPTLVYGQGGSQEFSLYVKWLLRCPGIIPMIAGGKAKKRPVWIEDVLEGLSLLVNNPVSFGKIYNFSGKTEVTMRQFTKILCEELKIRKVFLPIPGSICLSAVGLISLFFSHRIIKKDTVLGLIMDASTSHESAEKDLGYRPSAFHEGISREIHTLPM